ncbi:MAG: adenosine deaminase [Proteobacteria bacterium]|nr:adenosine deaminase [Pseudomonadota bacterium]
MHLEGAIPYESFWKLVQKYDTSHAFSNIESISEKFRFRDFDQFIDVWTWKNQFLREYEDFTFIAEDIASDLASQNIRYAEVFLSPRDFSQFGLSPQQLIESVRAGLDRVKGVEIALVIDVVRDYGSHCAMQTLAQINEVRDFGVVGIGLGGSESAFPPELFESVFEKARNLGYRTTAHAGEAAGAESIWSAIRNLGVDRIGHGTRAVEDEQLMTYLTEKRIPLEVCPTSNICTGVVRSIEKHPIRRFVNMGIPVTVGTDDPKMFGCDLGGEFHALAEKLEFTADEIRSLILCGIRSSWLPNDRKQQLEQEFVTDPNWRV